jgi:hypothetical protein
MDQSTKLDQLDQSTKLDQNNVISYFDSLNYDNFNNLCNSLKLKSEYDLIITLMIKKINDEHDFYEHIKILVNSNNFINVCGDTYKNKLLKLSICDRHYLAARYLIENGADIYYVLHSTVIYDLFSKNKSLFIDSREMDFQIYLFEKGLMQPISPSIPILINWFDIIIYTTDYKFYTKHACAIKNLINIAKNLIPRIMFDKLMISCSMKDIVNKIESVLTRTLLQANKLNKYLQKKIPYHEQYYSIINESYYIIYQYDLIKMIQNNDQRVNTIVCMNKSIGYEYVLRTVAFNNKDHLNIQQDLNDALKLIKVD